MAIDKGSEVVNLKTSDFGKVLGWSDLITSSGESNFGFKVKVGWDTQLWLANETAEWVGKGDLVEGPKKAKIGYQP